MKTLQEIKLEIIASNPSRVYVINGEEFKQTDIEFDDAIQKRAEMEYQQQLDQQFIADQKALKISGYKKLGLTNEEITVLLGLSLDQAEDLLA